MAALDVPRRSPRRLLSLCARRVVLRPTKGSNWGYSQASRRRGEAGRWVLVSFYLLVTINQTWPSTVLAPRLLAHGVVLGPLNPNLNSWRDLSRLPFSAATADI